MAIAVCLPLVANAQDSVNEVVRISNEVSGQVYTMLDNEKAPLIGKVSLTDMEGNTISSLKTDDEGNFSFTGLQPGSYKVISVAGDYVGDTEVQVTEGQQQNIAVAVSPASSEEILEAYASLPAASFSAAPAAPVAAAAVAQGGCSTCNTCNTCNTCSGGYSRGFGNRGFGGGGFGGGFGGGGFGLGGGGGLLSNRLVRLALIGGAIGIAVGSDDPASPDE